MEKLHFLTAGIPISAKPRNYIGGLERIKNLGLDGMELEFVRGVRLNYPLMRKVGIKAKELGLVLTAHAPYYVNLNSCDNDKIKKSYRYILDTARALDIAEGYSVVFHSGYYHQEHPSKVFSRIYDHLSRILEIANKEALKVWIRPELMGKKSQFGTLYELIELSSRLKAKVLPCIDFSHLHARTGRYNSYEEWEQVFDLIKNRLGEDMLREMHIHISGIDYNSKGEKKHLILRKSDFRYREFLKVVYDYDIAGVLVCESPNLEGDLRMLKNIYDSFG